MRAYPRAAGSPGRYVKAEAVQPQDSLTYRVCSSRNLRGLHGGKILTPRGASARPTACAGAFLGRGFRTWKDAAGFFQDVVRVGAIPFASAPGDSRLRSGDAGMVPLAPAHQGQAGSRFPRVRAANTRRHRPSPVDSVGCAAIAVGGRPRRLRPLSPATGPRFL